MPPIDYEHLFARTLHELICKIFPAHGIDSMPDDEFDALVMELTDSEFWATVQEYRATVGAPPVLPRMGWRGNFY